MGGGVQVRPAGAQEFTMLVAYQPEAFPWFSFEFSVPVRSGKRLRGIALPGIKTTGEQLPPPPAFSLFHG